MDIYMSFKGHRFVGEWENIQACKLVVWMFWQLQKHRIFIQSCTKVTWYWRQHVKHRVSSDFLHNPVCNVYIISSGKWYLTLCPTLYVMNLF
jgi:hypothetical protein